MAKCSLCGGKADEEDKCKGCEAYICQNCLEDDCVSGPHTSDAHFTSKREREQESGSSKAQTEALQKAWSQGAERARFSTPHFTRTVPIPSLEKPARLIHYCAKENIRQFFDVCKDKKCGHLRPLRPPDEGSCDFVPKKQKDEEKHINKKKNGKRGRKQPTTVQDREEEFVEGNSNG